MANDVLESTAFDGTALGPFERHIDQLIRDKREEIGSRRKFHDLQENCQRKYGRGGENFVRSSVDQEIVIDTDFVFAVTNAVECALEEGGNFSDAMAIVHAAAIAMLPEKSRDRARNGDVYAMVNAGVENMISFLVMREFARRASGGNAVLPEIDAIPIEEFRSAAHLAFHTNHAPRSFYRQMFE